MQYKLIFSAPLSFSPQTTMHYQIFIGLTQKFETNEIYA